jgi:hypothetical protein
LGTPQGLGETSGPPSGGHLLGFGFLLFLAAVQMGYSIMSNLNAIPFRMRNAPRSTRLHAVPVRLAWPKLTDLRAALAPAIRVCRMIGTGVCWIAWVFSLPVQAILLLYVGILSVLFFIGRMV